MNALDILDQFLEFEQSEQILEIIDNLKKGLEIDEISGTNQVFDFEKTEYPSGVKWMSLLYGFVQKRQPPYLDYKPFNMEEISSRYSTPPSERIQRTLVSYSLGFREGAEPKLCSG
ncbi:MAG: hypothetical protein ACI83W_002417 [Marinoscillum sp.]|jgi:hypothetical protein